MSLFHKFHSLAEDRRSFVGGGTDPFGLPIDEVLSPTEARIGDRRILLAGTNNYLGLTFDPTCLQAAHDALRAAGTGTTGSRMASGSFSGHLGLERELADFYGCGSAIVFSAGYLANLGIIATLAGHGDVILIDSDSHASIYDACRLSGATVIRFRHNDAESLAKRLTRLGDGAEDALIVVEGIYSMLGDRAPLAEFVDVKRRLGGHLLVDEAHSLGVLGETGRGLAQETGMEAEVDLIVGTFSKSLGGVGGFCVGREADLDIIRYASRPYIFTASPSPPVTASVRQALSIVRSRPELRERLWSNAERLYTGLAELGYTLGPEPGPIVAALFDSREQALEFWRRLLEEEHIYVNLIVPPAAPDHRSLVRCSVSAAHSPDQIERICEAFGALREVAASPAPQ